MGHNSYQWNLPEKPRLLNDLTKIMIGSSVSQIAISETSHKWRPPVRDHLTKNLIGSSVSQIAISETSHKQPSISNHLSLTSRVVTLYNINFVEQYI